MTRRVIYKMTVSLDGYIAGPGGDIGWSAPDEELFRFHVEQTRETRTFGSRVVYLRYLRSLHSRRG